jgi:hypothetical protein
VTTFFDAMGEAARRMGLEHSHVAYDLASAVHPDDMHAVLDLLLGNEDSDTLARQRAAVTTTPDPQPPAILNPAPEAGPTSPLVGVPSG